jgi:hypothetical protein
VNNRLTYLILFFAVLILASCAGDGSRNESAPDSEMEKSKKEMANWAADSSANGGFEQVPYEEQETGPGLVILAADSMAGNPVTTSLDTVALKQSVEQKLLDFYGYCEIIGNERYDKSMRDEAMQAVLGFMYAPDKNVISEIGRKNALKVKELDLDAELKAGSPGRVSVVFMPVHTGDSVLAKGVVSYSTSVNNTVADNTTEFFIRRVKKKFGTAEQEVNAVFLGNTSVNPRK